MSFQRHSPPDIPLHRCTPGCEICNPPAHIQATPPAFSQDALIAALVHEGYAKGHRRRDRLSRFVAYDKRWPQFPQGATMDAVQIAIEERLRYPESVAKHLEKGRHKIVYAGLEGDYFLLPNQQTLVGRKGIVKMQLSHGRGRPKFRLRVNGHRVAVSLETLKRYACGIGLPEVGESVQ